jgi:hypothetical protein
MFQTFRGTYRFHLQRQKASQERNQHEPGSKQSFLLALLFDPEDGGDTIFLNIG